MKVPSISMPNMQPVKDVARATGTAVIAGAKETRRVAVQTSCATIALVTLVALAVLTAIASPLYLSSRTRSLFTARKERTVEAFQNLKAQTRAIVYNPVKQASAVKVKIAAAAFVAVAGAALCYNEVPVTVIFKTANNIIKVALGLHIFERLNGRLAPSTTKTPNAAKITKTEAAAAYVVAATGVALYYNVVGHSVVVSQIALDTLRVFGALSFLGGSLAYLGGPEACAVKAKKVISAIAISAFTIYNLK